MSHSYYEAVSRNCFNSQILILLDTPQMFHALLQYSALADYLLIKRISCTFLTCPAMHFSLNVKLVILEKELG